MFLPQLLHLEIYPIRIHDLLILLSILLRAPTIVEIADVGAVEEVFLQGFIDLVVDVAGPCRGG